MKIILAMILASAGAVGMAHAQGDPESGEQVFSACVACHSIDEGEHQVGPSLHGVIGREAGSVEDFDYSDALAESGLTWDEETIADYVRDPEALVPGTLMVFPGIDDEEEITDLIAYLHQFSEE